MHSNQKLTFKNPHHVSCRLETSLHVIKNKSTEMMTFATTRLLLIKRDILPRLDLFIKKSFNVSDKTTNARKY